MTKEEQYRTDIANGHIRLDTVAHRVKITRHDTGERALIRVYKGDTPSAAVERWEQAHGNPGVAWQCYTGAPATVLVVKWGNEYSVRDDTTDTPLTRRAAIALGRKVLDGMQGPRELVQWECDRFDKVIHATHDGR